MSTRTKIALLGIALCASPAVRANGKDAASEKASLQSAFGKLAARIEAEKKAGPLTAAACEAAAQEFLAFGKQHRLAEAYFNAGAVYHGCGELKKAQAAYKEATNLNPTFAPALVNYGEALYREGSLGNAQSAFEAALKAEPKNVQAYNDLGLVLFDRYKASGDAKLIDDDKTGAIGRLRRALALDATSMPAYALLALIYYNKAETDPSKLDLAELICKQAKEVNEKYAPIYNTLGLIKLRKKNVTGALKEFKEAAAIDPAYVEAQLNIGAITLSARDYATAEKAFKAVLDAKPTSLQQLFDATIGMGVAVRGQRRIDEAEQFYDKARALNPKECAIPYNLGVLYQDYKMTENNSHLDKAKTLFNDFLACSKSDARTDKEKVTDATRRIKDVDDTFKALAEAKKLEEENRKLQEEMEKMQRVQEEQLKQQQLLEQQQQGKDADQKPAGKTETTPAGGAVTPAAGGAGKK